MEYLRRRSEAQLKFERKLAEEHKKYLEKLKKIKEPRVKPLPKPLPRIPKQKQPQVRRLPWIQDSWTPEQWKRFYESKKKKVYHLNYIKK